MKTTARPIQFIALVLGALANPAYALDCGRIHVDCHTHRITIPGMEPKVIDCGKSGKTPSTRGIVGGPHNGKIVKDGVDIRAPGMGQDGGGKVFHTPNPDDKSSVPSGQDTTKGCIGVDNEILEKLKTCAGSQLEIIGSNGYQDPYSKPDEPYNDKNTYKPSYYKNIYLKKMEKKAKKAYEDEAKSAAKPAPPPTDPPKEGVR